MKLRQLSGAIRQCERVRIARVKVREDESKCYEYEHTFFGDFEKSDYFRQNGNKVIEPLICIINEKGQPEIGIYLKCQ